MRKTVLSTCVILLLIHNLSIGQEVLLDLQTQPTKAILKPPAPLKSLLSLPFFDDFAYSSSQPRAEYWKESGVYINQSYSINAPTIGVATFDAINRKGELYSTLSTTAFPADTLTSQPLELNFPGDTNIYITFYYQARGLGKEPQTYDSLVLEFLDFEKTEWVRVWSASANFQNKQINEKHILTHKVFAHTSDTLEKMFFMVHMPILDDRFKKTGFQFRFINYASLSPNSTIPGLLGNSDHWNLDLVLIEKDKFFDDIIVNDVAFYKPLKSILKNYESIPWKHFNNAAKLAELPDPLPFQITYWNLGPVTWNITRRFSVTDLSGNTPPYLFSGGAENIYQYQTISYTREFLYDFYSSWDDSAKFLFKSFLITDIDSETYPRRWNDTLSYTQQFHNYYAYDDGSAENGYGLYGAGSETGMVAMKFHSYETDSLKGIMIFFNRTFQDASQQYFKLTVWNDNNGKPGDIIYQKTGIKPIFTDSLNVFTLYAIDQKIKIGGNFYIGWVQTTAEMLNVGFDLNKVHNSNLFYNLSGQWVNSQFEGSLMIRPVFGKLIKNPTRVEKPLTFPDVNLFPNPASTMVSIESMENHRIRYFRIIALTGQVVISQDFTQKYIDVSNLKTGVYIIQLINDNGIITTKKLIIAR